MTKTLLRTTMAKVRSGEQLSPRHKAVLRGLLKKARAVRNSAAKRKSRTAVRSKRAKSRG